MVFVHHFMFIRVDHVKPIILGSASLWLLPCVRVCLHLSESKSDITSRWVQREFNLMFRLGSDKDQRKNRFHVHFRFVSMNLKRKALSFKKYKERFWERYLLLVLLILCSWTFFNCLQVILIGHWSHTMLFPIREVTITDNSPFLGKYILQFATLSN